MLKSGIFILFIFISIISSGNNSEPEFKKYGITDGFSDISFRNVIQDKKGFLWFATINGINRFDGKNVKIYRAESGNKNSLSYNRVYNLLEDKLGYLWIMTYDQSIQRLNPENDKFINITLIYQEKFGKRFVANDIYQQNENVIWIFSRNNGAIRIIENDKDESVKFDVFNTSNLLPDNVVRFIYTDVTDATWIGTDGGLLKLNSEISPVNTDNYNLYYTGNEKSAFTVYCIFNDNILFGTDNRGVQLIDINKDSIVDRNFKNIKGIVRGIAKGKNHDFLITTEFQGIYYLKNINEDPIHLKPGIKYGDVMQQDYFRIYCDRYGLFWMEGRQRGVTLFNPEDLKIKHYGLNPEIRESAGDADNPVFHEDCNGDFWIGLYGGGIAKLDREKMKFDQYFHDPSKSGSISSNLVMCIFEDNAKNMWIGTYQGGLNKLELKKYPFNYIKPVHNPLFQTYNEVRALMIDDYDRIWLGTKEGHIYCYDNSYQLIFTFPEDLGLRSGFINNNVYELKGDINGNLLIGTKGYGLYIIYGILKDKSITGKKYKVRNFQNNPNDINSLSYNHIYAIYQDYFNQIWIGTYNGGLNVIKDINQIAFDKYNYDVNDTNSLSDVRIRYIMQDSKNNLWICTINGLNLLQAKYLKTKEKKFIRFKGSKDKEKTLATSDVICVFEDTKGRIWSGTYGGGLKLLHYDTVSFKYNFETFLMKDGLPSEVIMSIQEDKKENLWLGTDNGLCKFNYETKKVENYIKEEGLGDNLFSEGASAVNSTGKLFFGQKNGYVSFYPEKVKKDTLSYKVWIAELKILNKTVKPGLEGSPLNKTIESTDTIVLNYKQNFLEFKYAILDYINSENCQYEYKMEGIDDNWVQAGNDQTAAYTNLDPGEYIFTVRAANHDGFWSSSTAKVTLIIEPPYYKRWWFRVVIILLIFISAIGFYYYRVSNLKKQKILLEKQVRERTVEIENKNIILQKQKDELNIINQTLSERQEFIEKQSVELKHQKNELEKTNNSISETNTLLEERQQKVEEQAEELRVQAEDMALKNENLNVLNATKDKLFSIIAHDLKNPFNSILGFCKIILDKYDNMDDNKRLHLVNIIYNSAKNIFSLLDNLLQWSRSQIGSLSYNPERINLKELIDNNLKIVNNMLEQKNISLQNTVKTDLYVIADDNMLNAIVRNIITNSIKFTENGKISISAVKANGKVTIEISDTGVGMSNEKVEKIFEIERSKSSEGTKGEQGSGLGLIICKEFVEKHNGKIYARSTEGKGSVFGFTLPSA